jgi:hypothetical protein
MTVERADFDDLVTLVTQAPTWEKDRLQGVRILLRAAGEGKANAPEQILWRWIWRLARASRKAQDRRASAEFPEAKRLLGALANSRGHRHEENAARLVNAALELPIEVGAALLASAEGYTPRATQLIEAARERLGTLEEVAVALAENLPAPKQGPSKSRRRRRRKRGKAAQGQPAEAQAQGAETEGPAEAAGDDVAAEAIAEAASPNGAEPEAEPAAKPRRKRARGRKTAAANGDGTGAGAQAEAEATPEPAAEPAPPRPRRRTRTRKADANGAGEPDAVPAAES